MLKNGREIEFRGKSICADAWLYGYFLRDDHGETRILQNNVKLPMPILVIPETVTQYTGRKDLKGEKIFEADIFQHTETGEIGYVRYIVSSEQGRIGYYIYIPTNNVYASFMPVWGNIRGNKFDNPEHLLKESQ